MRQPSSSGKPWRVGRRIRIHLYDANDVPLGTMLTALDAALVVAAVNRVEGLDESGRILLARAQRAEHAEAEAARLLERYLEIERLHATDGRVTVAMEDRLRGDVRAWMVRAGTEPRAVNRAPKRKPLQPRKKRAKRKA